MDYVKYPRTWHLPDSPNRGADGDHAHADYSTFDGREVVVTEKLDGENTTIYADGHCHARSISSSYHPTRTWVRGLAGRVSHALPEGWRICGENTYGRHSIAYDRLPSYFQLFAVYDERDMCLSWPDTEEWARELDVDIVPVLFRGIFDKVAVLGLLTGPSAFGPEREGLVLRWAEAFPRDEHERATGKLVRKDHVKTDQHWMHGDVKANGLAR
jgi:RNA ligase